MSESLLGPTCFSARLRGPQTLATVLVWTLQYFKGYILFDPPDNCFIPRVREVKYLGYLFSDLGINLLIAIGELLAVASSHPPGSDVLRY